MFYKFKPFQGPEEFLWTDPDTGRQFKEKTKKDLVERIVTYRAQNNLPEIEELGKVLETYWCKLPGNVGKCEPEPLKRGLMGYMKGGISLVKNMVYRKYANKEEAEKRAAVCVQCPYNVFPDKDGFIKWTDEIAYHALGDRTTELDDHLGNCAICSCPMRVKIWYGGKDFGVEGVESRLPGYCWQKRKDGHLPKDNS